MPSYIRECHYGIAEVARVSSPIVRHLEVPGDFRAHYYYLPSKIAETYSRLYVFVTFLFFSPLLSPGILSSPLFSPRFPDSPFFSCSYESSSSSFSHLSLPLLFSHFLIAPASPRVSRRTNAVRFVCSIDITKCQLSGRSNFSTIMRRKIGGHGPRWGRNKQPGGYFLMQLGARRV